MPIFIQKLRMSAIGGKVDIVHGPSECLLMTQSGHSRWPCDFASSLGLADTLGRIARWRGTHRRRAPAAAKTAPGQSHRLLGSPFRIRQPTGVTHRTDLEIEKHRLILFITIPVIINNEFITIPVIINNEFAHAR